MTQTLTANPLKGDIRSHVKCIFLCWVATLATLQYGLDQTVVGGFLAMSGFLEVFGYYDHHLHRYNIEPVVQQLVSSLVVLGTFMGNLLVGPFSEYFGRKRGLQVATLLNFIAAAIQIGTTSKGVLYFARILLGFSTGWFLTFSQLYIQESAPAHLRGVCIAFFQWTLNVGLILGSAVDYGTQRINSKLAYRIPLALFFVFPTIQFVIMFFFAPESPRWLMVQNKEAEAESALRRLRNSSIDESEFQAEFAEIRQATREQIEGKSHVTWNEMWRGTNLRRTLLCVAVLSFHGGTGSSWIGNYTTYFFQVAGASNPFAYALMGNCIGLLGVTLTILIGRYVGRKVIVILGVLTCGISQLIPAICASTVQDKKEAAKVTVGFFCIFLFSYSAYTSFAWLLGGEYVNNRLRASTFGLATAVNFLLTWLGTFTAPYFINPAKLNWGAKYGYIWFGSSVIMALFTYFCLPETKDRTLEEIHEMFEAKIPARQFKSYVCSRTRTEEIEGKQMVGKEANSSTTHIEETADK